MKPITLIGIWVSLICFESCNNTGQNKEDIEQSESGEQLMEGEEKKWLSDSDVESLIGAHKTFFLSSYWAGMSYNDALEITRYNMKKEKLFYRYYLKSDDYLTTELKPDELTEYYLGEEWDFLIKPKINSAYIAKAHFNFGMLDWDSDLDSELQTVYVEVKMGETNEYKEILDLYKTKYREVNSNITTSTLHVLNDDNVSITIQLFRIGEQDAAGKIFDENVVVIWYHDLQYQQKLNSIKERNKKEFQNKQEKVMDDLKKNI